jgi:acylphosphatase
VRNASDGTVEIVASGTVENLQSFREQVEIGPSGSRVDNVIAEELHEQNFHGFRITRE